MAQTLERMFKFTEIDNEATRRLGQSQLSKTRQTLRNNSRMSQILIIKENLKPENSEERIIPYYKINSNSRKSMLHRNSSIHEHISCQVVPDDLPVKISELKGHCVSPSNLKREPMMSRSHFRSNSVFNLSTRNQTNEAEVLELNKSIKSMEKRIGCIQRKVNYLHSREKSSHFIQN